MQHTTQLLDDILLINKAEAGKLAFDPNSLDLVNFCRVLVEEMQLSSPQHNLVFSLQYQNNLSAGDNFVACMDKKLLRQILSNLLSNAVKYSPDNSNIQIDLLIQDKSAVFLIQDDGIGISPQEQQNLFEPFYRASNVGNIPGTGLGLAIVKKCVDLHRGRITIASQVGVGTTLRIELPLFITNNCG
ncbi:sensor histidine kinase [Nostoc sp. FACHB-145]|uniref:sensor histidine kinase n=1 Tax=Nostoc sp. FACHB-145 TaxID=2692836 RepID=UPI0028C42C15|nr:sensor histidine kinase [Nostoc sp. FACHB-145]